MQKDAKCVNTHAAGDGLLAGAINVSGPDDYVRDPEPFAVVHDDFVLFDFCVAIRFAPELGARFNWARLIQQTPPRSLCIGINSERTHVDKPLQALVTQACFEKIPSRNN